MWSSLSPSATVVLMTCFAVLMTFLTDARCGFPSFSEEHAPTVGLRVPGTPVGASLTAVVVRRCCYSHDFADVQSSNSLAFRNVLG